MKKIMAAALAVLMLISLYPSVACAADVNINNFDSKRYADNYPDLKAAFGYDHYALWHHYVNNGAAERRVVYTLGGEVGTFTEVALSSATFDSRRYADDYADLKAAFGYDHNALWNHYIVYGRTENRRVYTIEGQPMQGEPVRATFEAQFAQQMLSLVNAQRSAAGMSPLQLSDGAMAAARVRGEDFLRYYEAGYVLTNVPHIRPDGSSFTSAYAVRSPSKYGENVMATYWFSYDDAASFTARANASFAASSSHYLQMISGNYSYAGFYPAYIREYGAATLYVVIQEYHN
ncbi:MAG: hypothetical protein IJQ12_02045 [Lachnospiraceae bacterium]|nr:hypothetical protein [Lachnospiraceae bacterium]